MCIFSNIFLAVNFKAPDRNTRGKGAPHHELRDKTVTGSSELQGYCGSQRGAGCRTHFLCTPYLDQQGCKTVLGSATKIAKVRGHNYDVPQKKDR